MRCNSPGPVLVAVALLALAGLAGRAAAQEPSGTPSTRAGEAPPAGRFGEKIEVRLLAIRARAIDHVGNPILGLAPGDFRVRIGGREAPLAGADWVASSAPPSALSAGSAGTGSAAARGLPTTAGATGVAGLSPQAAAGPETAAPPATEGKLVVLFVQADIGDSGRIRGHLRTLHYIHDLLSPLAPQDRVAVVSYDSHLKLWLDFTNEREPVHGAVYQAMRFGSRPPHLDSTDPRSLAGHFDVAKAKRITSPEAALAATAAAVAPLAGDKVLILLGWGLGRYKAIMTPELGQAIRALEEAHTPVFVLDVTSADFHDLEIGLRGIAEATGGTYAQTYLFPEQAVHRLARTLSGYYVLTLDSARLPREGGRLDIELRQGGGTVLFAAATYPERPED